MRDQFKPEKPKKYNTQNTSKQVIKDSFSIRLKEYKKIWRDLEASDMLCPEQHYLIQGVRGSGKTTLLTRLFIAVEESEKFKGTVIPIQFKEEEYGISNVFSFFSTLALELEQAEELLFKNLQDDIENISADTAFKESQQAYKKIDQALKTNERKIILFVDNLVELFDNFAKDERALLREILSQDSKVRIVGASAIPLEAFYEHGEPFYQFFKTIDLKSLNARETQELLLSIGKASGAEDHKRIQRVIKQEPEKIESIRRLTGGVPRTIRLLFEILSDGPQDSTFEYLEDTLDMASPIYKHRMDDLTAQQKPIVHAIAQNWDAISAKEIAQKTRIESKTVSSQLLNLQKKWMIEKVKTDTKNHLYRIQERFFNIWYLTRYGRKRDKAKVRWLTQFLELWCSSDELQHRAKALGSQLDNTSYLPGALAYASALVSSDKLSLDTRQEVLDEAYRFFERHDANDFIEQLPNIENTDYWTEAFRCYFEKDFVRAEQYLNKLLQKNDYQAYLILGSMYRNGLKDYSGAETHYLKAIEHEYYGAYISLGYMYCDNLKDYEGAETYYLKAIEHEDYEAYIILGDMYCDNLKDYESAETHYLKAIEHEHYGAYINLGVMYCNDLKDYSGAETYCLKAIEHERYRAYLNLGVMYHDHLEDYNGAETYFLKALELNVDGARNGLAWLYFEQNDQDKKVNALELVTDSVEKEQGFENLHTLSCVALWNEVWDTAEQSAFELLSFSSWHDNLKQQDAIIDLMVLFLAKDQSNSVQKWFNKFELHDRFKPLSYVLMRMKPELYAREILRMGPELEDTVNEIEQVIEEKRRSFT